MKNNLSAGRPGLGPPGFSIIETLGVLALIAILGAVTAYSSLARLKSSHQEREQASLVTLARAFESAVIRSRTIPAAGDWAGAVATELGRTPGNVLANPVGNARKLMLDPALQLGITATNLLPYLQTASGSVHPSNLRAVLISSVGAPLPELTGDDFARVWDAPGRTLPAGWPTTWAGKGEDLIVERIDFGRLFRKVILNNLDGAQAAPYGVDASAQVTIPPRNRVEGWFFETSGVNLYYGSGVLQAREAVSRDASYVYENGRWGRSLVYGAGAGSTGLGELTEDFVNIVSFNNTAADDPLTSDTAGVTQASASTASSTTVTETETTTTTTTVHTRVKSNNGHGNNVDGVDSSNPGQGGGGPTGDNNSGEDPSGDVDDERTVASQPAYGTTSRDVVDSCHRFMKAYVLWSMKGRPVGGSTASTRHPSYRAVTEAAGALNDYTRNLANP